MKSLTECLKGNYQINESYNPGNVLFIIDTDYPITGMGGYDENILVVDYVDPKLYEDKTVMSNEEFVNFIKDNAFVKVGQDRLIDDAQYNLKKNGYYKFNRRDVPELYNFFKSEFAEAEHKLKSYGIKNEATLSIYTQDFYKEVLKETRTVKDALQRQVYILGFTDAI